ncbi:MAG: hypothetical protein LBH13_05385 [Cellulomonadaceae bacterium]|jgi:hypothetical protein|nr:hypothetical protein [Cellulomonadaceae bacterium]
MRPTREELEARAEQWAREFENYEPKDEDFASNPPPVMAVRLAAWKRSLAERELSEAVVNARSQSISWRALGEAIGTSGEAARQRYAHA